jgi:hypothetical protein
VALPGEKHLRICGVDISTWQVDFTFLPLDPADPVPLTEHYAIKMRESWARRGKAGKSGLTDWDAAIILARAVPLMPHWADVFMAFIEHGMGASRKGDWKLGRVQGVLLATIPEHVLVHEAMAGEWKKEYTGNGNAGKPLIEARGRKLGFMLPDENAYDSLGVAYAMRDKNSAVSGIEVESR